MENKKSEKIAIFNGKRIRRVWDDKKELWYFAVTDVIAVLTKSADSRNYWKVLKNRLKQEGSEVVTKCNQLKCRPRTENIILPTRRIRKLCFALFSQFLRPTPSRSSFGWRA